MKIKLQGDQERTELMKNTRRGIEEILIKVEIDSNTIIVGDLMPHLHQWIDHPDRKSIKKHWL